MRHVSIIEGTSYPSFYKLCFIHSPVGVDLVCHINFTLNKCRSDRAKHQNMQDQNGDTAMIHANELDWWWSFAIIMHAGAASSQFHLSNGFDLICFSRIDMYHCSIDSSTRIDKHCIPYDNHSINERMTNFQQECIS